MDDGSPADLGDSWRAMAKSAAQGALFGIAADVFALLIFWLLRFFFQ